MRRSSFLNLALATAVISAALWSSAAFGQMPGASPAGVNATLTRLFGNFTAFSAKADVRVLDKNQQETTTMPMDFTLLDEKIRVDLDLSKLKSKQMSAAAAQQLKQWGMEQITSIIRPDKKEMYILYPAMQSCLAMPLPKEEVESIDRPPKMEKSALGKETVDGHPCAKTQIILTDDKGQKREATTWNATDLKGFPVQIQTAEKDNTLLMRFSKVQFEKPDAKQFELPAGYTKYGDMQEMVMGMMKKAIGTAPGK